MATGYPCPNPGCRHVFAPASVKGAAALTCPKCGGVFRFQPAPVRPPKPGTPAPLAKPAIPVARPVATPASPRQAPPVAMPVAQAQPTPPAPAPVAERAAEYSVERPVVVALPSYRRRSSGGRWIIALLLTFLFFLTGAVAVALVLVFLSPFAQPEGQAHESTLYNYRYVLPPDDWQLDEELKTHFGANLALRRTASPSGTMVLLAKEYKKPPREAVLLDEGVRHMRDFFEGLEAEPRDDADWAGGRAQRFVFTALDPNTRIPVSGECYVLFHQGIGYWLATWAPAEVVGKIAPEFRDLRQRFSLMNLREGWVGDRPKPRTFAGTNAAYSLTDTEAVWERRDLPADYDAAADLALHGTDREDPRVRDASKTAQVLVLLLKLPDGAAPQDVARDYVLKKEKELYPTTTLETIDDQEKGKLERVTRLGSTEMHVAKLQMRNSKDRQRFVVLAATAIGDQVLAIYCECDLARRSLWERDFDQLVASLRR